MFTGPLFKNRYRIQSARWQGWNYGWNGWYFVTICTKDRFCYFGDIENGNMALSPAGKIASDCLEEIPNHFPFVVLDGFVVMPNHVHGILVIDKGESGLAKNDDESVARRDAINRVSTPTPGGVTQKHNPMGKGTIAEVVRWYKGRSTFEIHRMQNHYFAWQPRFHDHVIRDEFELNRIRKYVRENPEKWEEDTFYVQ